MNDVRGVTVAGRHRERGQIERLLPRAAAGTGGFLLLKGPTGVGRSHLLQFAVHRAREHGFIVVEAAARAGDRQQPFAPFIDGFLRLRQELTADQWAGWCRPLASWLAQATGSAAAHLPSSRLLADELLGMRRQADRPALIAVDDLQWCDPQTFGALEALIRAASGEHLLLVAACRDEDLLNDRELATGVHELLQHAGARSLTVGGLSLSGVRGLAERELAPLRPSGLLVHLLHERSGGNPLLLKEICAQMVRKHGGPDVPLSGTFLQAVRAGLLGLDPEARQILQLAAVAGEPFDVSLVAMLARRQEQEVEHVLARHRRLLVEDAAGGGLYFRQPLIREVLYGDLLPSARRRLHAQAVAHHHERLDEGRGDDAAQAVHRAQLSVHLERTGQAEPARGHFLAAAEQAEGAGHHRQAFSWTLRALALSAREDRAATALLASRRAWLAGLVDDARLHSAEVEAFFRTGEAAEAPEKLAELHLHQGHLEWLDGDGEAALQRYHHALELLDLPESEPRTSVWAWTLGRLGHGYSMEHRWELARRWTQRALGVARTLGLKSLQAHCLANMALIHASLGAQEEALKALKESRWLATSFGAHEELGRSYLHEVVIWHQVGRYDRALEAAVKGMEQLRDNEGVVLVYPALALARAAFLWCTGRWQETEAALPEVQALVAEHPSALLRSQLLALRARMATARGSFDAAEALMGEAEAVGQHIRSTPWVMLLRGTRARLLLARGRPEAAHQLAVSALQPLTPTGSILAAELAVCGLLAAYQAGVPVGGGATRPLLDHVPPPDEALGPAGTSFAWAADGLHALMTGQTDHAVASLERALAAATEMLYPEYAADVGQWLARALAQRDGAGDRSAALRHRHRALALVRALTPGSSPLSPGLDLGGLTPREREVALLVAEGLRNREIAERLFISERTAATHVSRILAKLELSSRTQLAGALGQEPPPASS